MSHKAVTNRIQNVIYIINAQISLVHNLKINVPKLLPFAFHDVSIIVGVEGPDGQDRVGLAFHVDLRVNVRN